MGFRIALLLQVSVEDLAAANDLSISDRLTVGQVLRHP